MDLRGKALFNLLRMNWLEDPTVKVEPWQVETLRDEPTEALFKRLWNLGVVLDERSFALYAESCDSPEDLVECVWIDDIDHEGHDKVYLIVFELWRRLLTDRLSPSIFCDQLDYLIDRYDVGESEDEAELQDALSALEDILDDSSDAEGSPQQVFAQLSSYCAHDLERFIFDYINDQIGAENGTYASELLDAFVEYVSDVKRFDFLRARICLTTDIVEANILYERLLDSLTEAPDVEMLLMIAESLIHRGDVRLFMMAIRLALPHLGREEQFQDVLSMVADYYRCLDRENEESAVNKMLSERAKLSLEDPFHSSDAHLSHFLQLLKVLPD
ncbi:MAG: hypothetical protein V4492_08605 [Chlamydiota bacterium]